MTQNNFRHVIDYSQGVVVSSSVHACETRAHLGLSGCCSHATVVVPVYVYFLLADHFCWWFVFRPSRSTPWISVESVIVRSSHRWEPILPVASTMTHECKLLKSSVFCWKLPLTSKEGEQERKRQRRREGFCLWAFLLVALLHMPVAYINSNVWHTKQAAVAPQMGTWHTVGMLHKTQAVGL